MRLLTPAAALVSAVAIAMASTGLVVHRSADDRRAGEFGALTQAVQPDTASGAPTSTEDDAASEPTSVPTHVDGERADSTSVPDVPAAGGSRTPPDVEAVPSTVGSRSGAEPAVIADDGLFIVDPAGSKTRQITDGLVYDVEWLSDSRIAYVRGSTLWLSDADGSDKRQVHNGVTDGGFRELAVSPDRRWIAFVAATAGSNPRPVWLMRSDGTGVSKIWNDTFNSSLGWAPDSNRLAFVSGGDEPLGMYVYDVDDDTASLLHGGFASSPVWTPTGTEVVFTDGSIVAVNVVTKEYRSLVQTTAGRVWSLVLDPSATRVFYADMDGWRTVPITGGPSRGVGSNITAFDWTTSGDRAALVRETGEQDYDGRRITELAVANPDFGARRTIALAGTYATIGGPTWSPKGERILVTSSLNKTPHPKP